MKSLLQSISVSLFNRLFSLLKNRTPSNLSREEIRFAQIFFSQFGEDLAVVRWAETLQLDGGKYLDIGAFHPIQFSNTWLLHRAGWRGVNIDMNPEKIRRFDHFRPEDDNVCCAISAEPTRYAIENIGQATEYLRTLSPNETDATTIIETKTLQDALKSTKLENQKFDYLNIDCEGHDFHVLQQIDLDSSGPAIITIEALSEEAESQIQEYLESKNYQLREKIHWTLLFTRNR